MDWTGNEKHEASSHGWHQRRGKITWQVLNFLFSIAYTMFTSLQSSSSLLAICSIVPLLRSNAANQSTSQHLESVQDTSAHMLLFGAGMESYGMQTTD